MSPEADRKDQLPGGRRTDSALVELIGQFIRQQQLIPAGSLVLAAVSGGQDSMALLSILHRLAGPLRFRLAVGHFDHRLRAASSADRSLVESYADSLGLRTYAGSADVQKRAKSRRESLEEAARKARYAFLVDTAGTIGAGRIATGHTSTDQVETVLLHILRGAGIRGLAGIPARREGLIRPLLWIDRRATADYCRQQGIPIAVDPTNLDTRFARNKIRRDLVPVLVDCQPDAEANILRLSQHAAAMLGWIRERTQPLLNSNLHQPADREWTLDISSLKGLEDTELVILFGDLFTEKMGLDMDFTRAHFDSLLRLVRKTAASGKRLSLPGLKVTREYDNLHFSIRGAISSPPPAAVESEIAVPGTVQAGGRTIRADFIAWPAEGAAAFSSDRWSACLAYDAIEPPLMVRHPRPGDRIQPFGMRGSKKLSDIFIDKKIPGRSRSRALVVTDRKDVLWLVGLVTSEKGRIDRNTKKILKINIDQE